MYFFIPGMDVRRLMVASRIYFLMYVFFLFMLNAVKLSKKQNENVMYTTK